jgi:hypothetical protein
VERCQIPVVATPFTLTDPGHAVLRNITTSVSIEYFVRPLVFLQCRQIIVERDILRQMHEILGLIVKARMLNEAHYEGMTLLAVC